MKSGCNSIFLLSYRCAPYIPYIYIHIYVWYVVCGIRKVR